MFNSAVPYSVPVAPIGGNGGMFGGEDGILGILLIIALLGGGFGGNGGGLFGGKDCATQADVRAAVDQQTLISKLDQQTYGLADSTYAISNSLTNGFHGVDNAICTLGYQNQQGFNTLAHQISDCCCATQNSLKDISYNMATQACETRQAIADSTKSILDFIVNDKLATLQAENQNLKLQASQAAQNAYLLSELKPCPSPAYVVPNPNCGCGFGYGNVVVGA